MASVTLDRVSRQYENGVLAVTDFSLDIADGELVVLVGPSGCGKTTVLRAIAGLEPVTSGDIHIGDRRVNDVPPRDRDTAMVFQNYALYPHMSVYDNLAFGLKLRKLKRAEIEVRVRDAAEMLGITDVLDRRPARLSGGQRQRVAVGRALVRQPRVFLFDEPLSNLDAQLRVQTRKEIARLHRRLGTTMIYVTHDQVEAMTLGQRIVVMKDGRVQQIDAGFMGSPAMNFVTGRAVRDGTWQFRATDASCALTLPSSVAAGLEAAGPEVDVVLGVRPEHVRVVHDDQRAPVHARMTLDLVEPMGNELIVYTRSGAGEVVARIPPGALPAVGSMVGLVFDTDWLHFFDTQSGAAMRPRERVLAT
jgi:multiple sugar transport system ATP-binding protein